VFTEPKNPPLIDDEEQRMEDLSGQIVSGVRGIKIRGLRWWIIGLIFLATLINYIDRLTISVLAPLITKDLNLTNTEFGGIATTFLLAYTIGQGLSGKIYDRVGIRRGFTFSIVLWSIAAMAHAVATGLRSISAFRFVLGLGEAGNWPGAAKTVAEWFPARERAFGMAIFNSGAAIGSVVAPPLIVGLTAYFGDWHETFIVTGLLGFGWLILWLLIYDAPERHKWLSRKELQLIKEDNVSDVHSEDVPDRSSSSEKTLDGGPGIGWLRLLNYKQTWGIILARFFVDPVWWLFITWLPLFMHQVHGFDLKQIGLFAWVPYVAADAGSLFGGWLSGFLIGRGWSINSARKAVIGFSACLMPAGILAAFTPDPMAALALIGIVLFGFQSWINNVQTLPSDFFPSSAVGSIAGLGGTGAGIGSMIFIFATGWVVDRFSYAPILIIAGLLAPLGTVVLFVLCGRVTKLSIQNVEK